MMKHLYVHVPFCARKCSYCDFAIAVRKNTPVDEYLSGLAVELKQKAEGWKLSTLYFGGGTPSRLGSDGISRAIQLVRDVAEFDADIEITIEVNPDDVSEAAANGWIRSGVNRVSLGMQSFNQNVLQWMHRTHSAEQSRIAVRTLKSVGIDNISLDLIFAIPEELKRDWKSDVDAALSLEPKHISLYGLTAEPQTPLGKWVSRGEVREASEDTYEEDFLYAHSILSSHGFEHYEVSNYGLPGFRSRHNSSYWKGVSYVGVGPSAHGFDGSSRMWNIRQYSEWVDALREGKSAVEGSEVLSKENRNAERVYLGLRTVDGLIADKDELEMAKRWIAEGWAVENERTLVLTPTGWLRLDALASALTGQLSG